MFVLSLTSANRVSSWRINTKTRSLDCYVTSEQTASVCLRTK